MATDGARRQARTDNVIASIFNRNRGDLLEAMSLRDTLLGDRMVEKGILTSSDLRSLMERPDRRQQNKQLLSYMEGRSWSDFLKFREALIQTNLHRLVEDWPDSESALQEMAQQMARQKRSKGVPLVGATQAKRQQVTGNSSGSAGTEHWESNQEYQDSSSDSSSDGNDDGMDAIAVGVGVEEMVFQPAPSSQILSVKNEIQKAVVPEKCVHSTVQQYADIKKMEKCYPMRQAIRGRGLVVTMTGKREGWQQDVVALASMFKYLNVQAEYKFDLKLEELLKELKDFARSQENASVDCLFVVLMGHGVVINNKECLQTADGGHFAPYEKMKEIFNNEINRVLVDKPKIFLIQTCRGGDSESGVPTKGRLGTLEQDANPCGVTRKVGSFSDYVFGFATQSGSVAHRDTVEGSWYIQELTSVVLDDAHIKAVPTMLMEVNRRLEERAATESVTQVSECQMALKAPLYLFPGVGPTQ